MKNPVNSNIYEKTFVQTWELYESYLSGCRESVICVLSTHKLSSRAKKAFNSSFARLGYGKAACTFLTLEPRASEDASLSEEPPPSVLSEVPLFALIEGLDPLFLIISDEPAVKACGMSYRQTIPLLKPCRVFGRETRTFFSFENMLESDEEKRKAWKLLKTFPQFPA